MAATRTSILNPSFRWLPSRLLSTCKPLPPITPRTGPPEEACVLKTDDGWTPPQIINYNPYYWRNMEIGGWIVKFNCPAPQDSFFTDRQMYNLCVNTLGRLIGKEEAKKKIYVISNHPFAPGFCATIDHEIVYKLRDLKGINGVLPDFLRDARMRHPDTYPMGQGRQAAE